MNPIKILRMARGAGSVSITNQTISNSRADPLDCVAQYRLNTNGNAERSNGLGGYSNISGEWLVSGSASAFEARFTPTIGTLTSGPSGWNALSSNLEFIVSQTSVGTKSCTGSLEIGLLGTSTALDTATIELTAEVT